MRVSIESRLMTLLALFGALLFGATALDSYELYDSNGNLRMIYQERVVCLRDISRLKVTYDNILRAMRLVICGELTRQAASKVVTGIWHKRSGSEPATRRRP